jgi:hypothetical protein
MATPNTNGLTIALHQSPAGKALDDAQAKGWTVADMKSDWKTIFAFGSK